MTKTLSTNAAHLWYVRTGGIRADLLRRCETLLSDDERLEWARFRFAETRVEYAVARAVVRTALSQYAEVAPERWRFARNAYGRPEISAPRDVPPLKFNLSHTRGGVACLVGLDRDVGVDVEETSGVGDIISIASRYFAPAEAADLLARPEAERRARFFDYWTLKESYIKALGIGLQLPLDCFSFDLDHGPIRISFAASQDDQATRWQFAVYRPSSCHVMAAAVRTQRESEVRLDLLDTSPLEVG
jgi:4'-phosphopantetheinyl transferase